MKPRFDKKLIATALAISSLALLSGCGQNTPPPVLPPAAPGVPGAVGGGCVPINTTNLIAFTATGMYIEQSGSMRVLAGTIPPGDQVAVGSYGTVMLSPGGMPPVAGYSLGTLQGSRVDGTTINLNVQQGTGVAAPMPGQVPGQLGATGMGGGNFNVTGTIQVSSFIQQILVQTASGTLGYNFGQPLINAAPGQIPGAYPGAYPGLPAGQQVCVSNVALSLRRTLYTNWLYLGTVYFYLTGQGQYANGQHGLALDF